MPGLWSGLLLPGCFLGGWGISQREVTIELCSDATDVVVADGRGCCLMAHPGFALLEKYVSSSKVRWPEQRCTADGQQAILEGEHGTFTVSFAEVVAASKTPKGIANKVSWRHRNHATKETPGGDRDIAGRGSAGHGGGQYRNDQPARPRTIFDPVPSPPIRGHNDGFSGTQEELAARLEGAEETFKRMFPGCEDGPAAEELLRRERAECAEAIGAVAALQGRVGELQASLQAEREANAAQAAKITELMGQVSALAEPVQEALASARERATDSARVAAMTQPAAAATEESADDESS